uniref:Ig-like domain-containing protein n=1 Tax=Cyprinodon variegatus TaxID=28743 RepID=A0A3Q2D376_CYPVA
MIWLIPPALVSALQAKEGDPFVLLPCQFDTFEVTNPTVLWTFSSSTVHRRQQGEDQLQDQDPRYRGRTSMRTDALADKDLSLNLTKLVLSDSGNYSCISVLLPCKTTACLSEDVRVEWTDEGGRKVHVYENGSDLPDEQDGLYKTRTAMEKKFKSGDVSLTLKHPSDEDKNIYTCKIYSQGKILTQKTVTLYIKGQRFNCILSLLIFKISN